MNRKILLYLKTVFFIFRGIIFKRHTNICGKLLRVLGRVTVHKNINTNLSIGDKVVLYGGVGFYLDGEGANIFIGSRTFINRRTEIMCKDRVSIGRDCAISWDVVISDTDYHSIDNKPITSPVNIGDNVWIGCRAVILKGVNIGDGSVIGAGAIVTKDVPANSVVVGNQAKVLDRKVKWAK